MIVVHENASAGERAEIERALGTNAVLTSTVDRTFVRPVRSAAAAREKAEAETLAARAAVARVNAERAAASAALRARMEGSK